jgi:tetratricopeptide (TPR) repeat protein
MTRSSFWTREGRGITLATAIAVVGTGVALVGSRDVQRGNASESEARALYDQALVAQRQARYRDAREGYLRALAVDPRMADARYNLAVLTHAAGADDEARHDLEALTAAAPDDPRIPGLRASLAKP